MPTPIQTTLAELKRRGSAGTKKIYLRHGACEPLFGVKFADLNQLKKRIGVDQDLANQLWASGNCDAQTLALMVADPDQVKSSQIDGWMRSTDYALLLGMLAGLAAKTSFAAAKWRKWSKSKSEATLVAAYDLISAWLKQDAEQVPAETVEDALKKIEAGIHDAPNLARHAMNNAIIAVGVFCPEYRSQAIKVAKAVGKVQVDHGETNCKTPDAAAYIQKAVTHNRKRKRC